MLKQMALRIATLADADRQWLLAHLSGVERQKLEPLIEEAMSLGLHLDPSVLSALTKTVDAAPAPTTQTIVASSVLADQLRTAQPFWRDVLTGSADVADITSDSDFRTLLGTQMTGPAALRQCIADYFASARETEHV